MGFKRPPAPSLRSRLGSAGLAPLHLAAAGGYEECVEALLEAKADPLAVCSTQRTPLHYAAQVWLLVFPFSLLPCRAMQSCHISIGRDAA